MLPFKKPQPAPEAEPSRWNVGIEKERVAMFVGVALIVGFFFGYATSRFMSRAEEAKVTAREKAEDAGRAKTEAGQPVVEFHKVTRILRADTVDVDGVGAVRMIGVETPDGKLPAVTYEAHGKNALAFTDKNLLNQEVRLEFDPSFAAKGNKDAGGQTLAYLYTNDGRLFNAELLKQGHAFVREEPFKLSEDFHGYEREAIAVMRGLWGMDDASGSSTTASATSPATTPSASSASGAAAPGGASRPGKLSPLAPSDIGPNIPAISGSSTSVATNPSEPMVYISGSDKVYHKSGCELLSPRRQLIPLAQARSTGFMACGRCFPSTSMKAH